MGVVDTHAIVLGFSFGAVLSGIFFASLAISIRIAMNARRPAVTLLLCAGSRILLFMVAGYWVVDAFGGQWCLVGFIMGFYLVRLLATSLVPTVALNDARSEDMA